MPVRSQPIDSEAAAFTRIFQHLREIDDTLRGSALPPGYTFDTVAGQLVITRESDGATSTLDFT